MKKITKKFLLVSIIGLTVATVATIAAACAKDEARITKEAVVNKQELAKKAEENDSINASNSSNELETNQNANAQTNSSESKLDQTKTNNKETKQEDVVSNQTSQNNQENQSDTNTTKNIDDENNTKDLNKTTGSKEESNQKNESNLNNKESETSSQENSENTNKQQQETEPKQNEATQPKEEPKKSFDTLKQEMQVVLDEAKHFLSNFLNDRRYEISKDELENMVLLATDFLSSKFEYQDLEIHLKEFQTNFEEIKNNYQNKLLAPPKNLEGNQNEKDKKDSSNTDTLDNYTINLQTNKLANQFMDMVDISTIQDIEHKGYDSTKKEAIKQFVIELVKDAKNEFEKITLIFNWITNNVKYANDPRRMPEIEPYQVFVNKYAVCGGYSNLYKAMLDSIGIKNSVVIGWSKYGDHQWNLVYDSQTNKFFHSDPTWGRGYLNKSEADFARDHKTYKILETTINQAGINYEYNYGVSVHSANEAIVSPLELLGSLEVTRISNTVFNQTTKTLNLSQNIKIIDYTGGTNQLTTYNVDGNNPYFSSIDGVLYNKDQTILLNVPKNHNAKTILIPKTTIKLEDDKQSIESLNLESITVEFGNYWLASYDGVLYNDSFSKIIKIPNQKQKLNIHFNAQLNAHDISFLDNLKEIKLQEGISFINEFSFNALKNVETIYLPSTLTHINKQGFLNINKKVIFKANQLSKELADQIIRLFSKDNYQEI